MNGKPWTQEQLLMLDALYPDSLTSTLVDILGHSQSGIYRMAKQRGICKSDKFKASDLSGRVQRGKQNPVMRATQFKPGHTVWNKGKKGWSAPGTEVTRFKKGSQPHNTKADGVIVLRKDNRGIYYYHIRIALNKWVYYHRYLWEQANGPIPKGMCAVFVDGNPMNCQIDNIKIISRKENVLRNSINRYGPEVREIMMLTAKAQKLINKHKTPVKHGEE